MASQVNASFIGSTLTVACSVRELPGLGARPGGLAVRFGFVKIKFGTALTEKKVGVAPHTLLWPVWGSALT